MPRERLRLNNGISVEGRFERNEQIIAYSERIIQEVGCHGNIGIQVKESMNGEFMLLEVNPRVQGTIVSALGVGVNLPLAALQREMGFNPAISYNQVLWGTRFIRDWEEVFFSETL